MAKASRTERRRSPGRERKPWQSPWLWGLAGLLLVAIGVWGLTGAPAPQAGAEGQPVSRFMHVHGLEIPAWAPDEVYVSTHQGLIRIDAEGEWRFVSREPHDFMGFAAHPSEPGVLYSSGHPAPGSGLRNPIGFMASQDGGVTWAPVALEGQTDFHALAVYPGDGDVIYGWNVTGQVGLYRSQDGGQNWERRAVEPLAGARGVLSLAVHPTEADRLLAGTPDGLWRSADGGGSWEQMLPDVPVTAVAYSPEDPDSVLLYGAAAQVGLAWVEDGAASLEALGFVLPGDDVVFHIAVHPLDHQVIYLGTMQEHLFKTTDGGDTWQQLAEGGVPSNPSP